MDGRSLSRLTRIVGPFASLWLMFATAIVLFAALEIHADRAAAVAAAREETEAFARAARAHLADTLAMHDHALTLKKIVHERRLGPVPLVVAGDDAPVAGVLPRAFAQYDREGRLLAGGESAGPAAALVADEPWFDEARARNAGELIVGVAEGAAATAASAIPLVKRLETPDGAFDGVIVTHVEPARLLRMLGTLSTDERMTLTLVDRGGARQAGTRTPRMPLAKRGSTGEAAVLPHERGGAEGGAAFVARAELPGGGLAVVAALDEEAALAQHRRHARTTIVFAGLALVAISLTLVIVGRRAFAERDRRRQLERRYAEARSRARTDPLTLVANRAAFDGELRIAHAILAADGRPFILAFIDIDRFKALNDRFGHPAGDRALRRVARVLRDAVRREDTVARLGGDEFAVLLPGGSALAMRRVFDPVRERLRGLVAQEGWPIGFSIGVVAFETAPSLPREALHVADRVMYAVKAAGRDGVRYSVYREGALQQDAELQPAAA